MELIYDWKNFQNFFYLKKRFSSPESSEPIYIIVEGRVVITVFSEGGNFSEWVGTTYDEVILQHPNRDLILFERKNVDECLTQAVGLTHFYDQMKLLHSEGRPRIISKNQGKGIENLLRTHFLLKAIESWWNRVSPSTYGIYICLEGNKNDSILITIQRGRVGSFQVPDLSSMVKERRHVPTDVVKFLAERYLIPIQGLFVTADEWNEWSELSNPWPKIASALKADRSKLVPFNWGFASLIFGRAYLGL